MKKLIIPAIVIWSFILGNFADSYDINHNYDNPFTYKGLEYWTITLTAWDISITMLDRNLWATAYMNEPWANSGQWMWKYYQRWSTQEWDIAHSGRTSDDYSYDNEDDWWWAQDTYGNGYYKQWRNSYRQWPCPEWYHIPSNNEWNMLFYIFEENINNRYSKTDDDKYITWGISDNFPWQGRTAWTYAADAFEFFDAFKMPLPWIKWQYNSEPSYLWIRAIYWSSNAYKNTYENKIAGDYFWFDYNEFQFFNTIGWFEPAAWASVRCFQNDNNNYSAYFLRLNPGNTWDYFSYLMHPVSRLWITFYDSIIRAYYNYYDWQW